MKTWISVLALVLFVAGSSATAAEVSKSTLSGMGLSGMQQLSDHEGQSVRGKGTFAYASGTGVSYLFNAASQTSSYSAGSTHNSGTSMAGGSNLAQVSAVNTFGHFSTSIIISAVGSSTAFAK